VLSVNEKQIKCTVKHKTLMPLNSVLHVSVHQNYHQFKKHKSICRMKLRVLEFRDKCAWF